jgi:hypothetical protein
MLVLFAFYLKFDSESFTQTFLLVIGITGVFSSNPITYFYPRVAGGRFADHILMAIFAAIFRMFLILELEMLRSHSTAPKSTLTIILAVIFAFIATVDAAANYDRQSHITHTISSDHIVLQTEWARAALHLIYAVAVSVYLVLAICGNDGINARRLWYFGFSVVCILLVTLFTDVYCVVSGLWMYTFRPSLLSASTIATFAGMTLFMLHSGGLPAYVGLDKVTEADHQVIELDQISDDAGEDQADADEEEEINDDEEEE